MCAEGHHCDDVLHALGDVAVAAVATAQGGAISTAQLNATGLGRGAIHLRARRGRLHRVYRGVYAVGHPGLTARGRLWAAILACGGPEAALLSHRSAAAVWDLHPRSSTSRRSAPRTDVRASASTGPEPSP